MEVISDKSMIGSRWNPPNFSQKERDNLTWLPILTTFAMSIRVAVEVKYKLKFRSFFKRFLDII